MILGFVLFCKQVCILVFTWGDVYVNCDATLVYSFKTAYYNRLNNEWNKEKCVVWLMESMLLHKWAIWKNYKFTGKALPDSFTIFHNSPSTQPCSLRAAILLLFHIRKLLEIQICWVEWNTVLLKLLLFPPLAIISLTPVSHLLSCLIQHHRNRTKKMIKQYFLLW